MAAKRLFYLPTLPPTLEAPSNTFEIGQAFTLEDGTWPFVGWGWYNPDPTGNPPSKLRLWRAFDQTLLATQDPAPDNNTVGTQEAVYGGTLNLDGGVVYVITGQFASGAKFASLPNASRGSAQFPLVWVDPPYRYTNAGSLGYPGNSAAGINAYIYPIVSDGEVSDLDVATEGGIENSLARWLDATDAPTMRPNSLPVLIYDYLQTMQGVINEVQGKVDDVDDVVTGILGPSGTLFTGLLAGYLDNLDTLIDQTLAAVDALRGPGDPTVADVLTAVNAIPTTGGGGLPAGPVSMANGWTLRTFTTGVGTVKWDEPADAYILVRAGWDASRSVNDYAGVNYFFDRGWWAPHQDSIIEGYGTLASEFHLLRVPTGRMSGVLIVQDPDFEWTLEAWDAPSP